MDNILIYFRETVTNYWCTHGYDILCNNWPVLVDSGLLIWGWAIFLALIVGLRKGSIRIWKWYRDKKLTKFLRPHYSYTEVEEATRYFVSTRGQSKSPTDHEDPNKVIPRQNLLDLFINEIFLPSGDIKKFYAILGGAGMGKTTFFINLVLSYRRKLSWRFWRIKNPIYLFPLADPKCLERIKSIERPENAILLLDALDEDPAVRHEGYAKRLRNIVLATQDFRTVIISSRTQFFPDESQEPGKTEIPYYGPKGGIQHFEKIYIAPFTKKDIRLYLRKRFPFWQYLKRKKANQVITRTENLMVRPLLLSYIKSLILQLGDNSLYSIYERVINDWIDRESKKPIVLNRPDFKDNLYKFSLRIAKELLSRFRTNSKAFIPEHEFIDLADQYKIGLNDLEMKNRSLLNRNALGEYKFAHKSIWEFFLATYAILNAKSVSEMQFEGMDLAHHFYEHMRDIPIIPTIKVKGNAEIPDFEIGKYQVSQEQWNTVMGLPNTHGEPYQALDNISFEMASQFIRKLNKRTGSKYRLPYIYEWIWVAIGGQEDLEGSSPRGTEIEERLHGFFKVKNTHEQLNIFNMIGYNEWCWEIIHQKDDEYGPKENLYVYISCGWSDNDIDKGKLQFHSVNQFGKDRCKNVYFRILKAR